VQTESNSETEIAGAHPNDRDSAKNRSYSQRESSGRQETMAKTATEKAASKVAEYLIDASKHKAQDYALLGGHLESVEFQLRHGALLSESKRAGIVNILWAQSLSAQLPDSGGAAVEQLRFARELPRTTLSAKRLSAVASKRVATPVAGTELTIEQIVKAAGPAVVNVKTLLGEGTGFLVKSDGLILTNAHVVAGARDVAVQFADRRRFMASVVTIDARKDIATLRVEGRDFPILDLRNRADPEVTLIQTDAAINSGNSGGPLLRKTFSSYWTVHGRGETLG
jgi:Trypsin-like peptidase domain